MLEINNYTKKYNQHLILTFDKLDLGEGIHQLKGINGSGKSTLIHSIAGIIPFEGEVILNKKINQKSQPIEFRKLVNYSDAEPKYPTYLSGDEVIKFISKCKSGTKNQVASLYEYFEVNDYIRNPISTYSSGMLKKTNLIQAFLGNPELILLDEPLTTIDKKSSQKLIDLIIEFATQKKTNFIIATHQELCDEQLKTVSTIEVSEQTISIKKNVF